MTYGIKVRNPQACPMRVEVVLGNKVVRSITAAPHKDSIIDLDKPGEYDVWTYLLNPDNPSEVLGDGGITVVDHQEVESPMNQPYEHVSRKTIKGGYWQTIARVEVDGGEIFQLRGIEVKCLAELDWQLKMGRQKTHLDGIITFEDLVLTGGQAISVQARCLANGEFEASCRVSGSVTVMHRPTAGQTIATGKQAPQALVPSAEFEERPVRSLADMLKELEKQEVLP